MGMVEETCEAVNHALSFGTHDVPVGGDCTYNKDCKPPQGEEDGYCGRVCTVSTPATTECTQDKLQCCQHGLVPRWTSDWCAKLVPETMCFDDKQCDAPPRRGYCDIGSHTCVEGQRGKGALCVDESQCKGSMVC